MQTSVVFFWRDSSRSDEEGDGIETSSFGRDGVGFVVENDETPSIRVTVDSSLNVRVDGKLVHGVEFAHKQANGAATKTT